MAKEQLSMRIESSLLEQLNKIIMNGISNNYSTQTSKIEALLKMTIQNYNNAGRSLIGRFTEVEARYIAQAFNSVLIQYELTNTKYYFKNMLENFKAYGSEGFFCDKTPDFKALFAKIDELDDMQALFIINSVQYFWQKVAMGEKVDIADLAIVQQ